MPGASIENFLNSWFSHPPETTALESPHDKQLYRQSHIFTVSLCPVRVKGPDLLVGSLFLTANMGPAFHGHRQVTILPKKSWARNELLKKRKCGILPRSFHICLEIMYMLPISKRLWIAYSINSLSLSQQSNTLKAPKSLELKVYPNLKKGEGLSQFQGQFVPQ